MDTSVSTPQAVATVISVEGQAFARTSAGQMRPLKAGDVLREGETVITMPGGEVQLAFVDGHILTVLPNETFHFSAETSTGTRPGVSEASLPAGEVERVIQALERGDNIDDQLDPTAAGLEGGGENGGNSFIRLMRIVEGVSSGELPFGSGFTRAGALQEEPSAALTNSTPTNVVSSGTPTSAGTVTPVNDAPVANAVSASGAEDAASISIALSATDLDGTIASYTVSSLPANGTLYANAALTTLVAAGDTVGATVYFVPGANWNGNTGFNYTATDNGGLVSNSAAASITVTPVNDAPVAVNDAASVAEDATVTRTALTGVLSNDTDPDIGDTKTVTDVASGLLFGTVGSPLTGIYGTLTLNADGSYSYIANRPAAQALAQGQVATEDFEYTMRDSAGVTSSALLTITVTGTNDAAVITGTSTAALTETNAVQSTSGTLSATDVDSSNAFVVQTNVAGSNNYGSFSINAAGAWTYTMNTAHNEFVVGTSYTDSITVTTADGTPQIITVTIAGTNDAAVITGTSTAALTETNAVQSTGGTLSATDVDSPATFVAQTNVAGSNNYGSFSINSAGAWTYTMSTAHNEFVAGTNYTDSITVTTADGTPQVLTVTITGTNDAPVANPDTLVATEDTPVIYTAAQLLGNDTDAEGSPLSIASVVSGAGGSAVLNGNGTVTFTPNANFSGAANFTYVASDGTALSNSALVTVNVTAVADAPQLFTPVQLNALVAGVSSADAAVSEKQASLAAAIGLPSATLDSFDPPPGPGTNDPGTVKVNDGGLTNYSYTLSSGMSVVFDWAFTNLETSAADINKGFNDIAVLVITNPDGTQTSTLITSSEQAGAGTNTSGTYNFTAAAAGSYQFSWLALNGIDTQFDSSIAISNIAFQLGASTFGTPVEFPISTALVDTDGSETLSVSVAGVPAGAAFSAGTNLGGGIWSFTPAQLTGLIFLPADGYTGTLNLTVTSTTTETSNGSTASTTQTVAVTVAETTNTIIGTDLNNNLTGTAGNDHIQGLSGNDTLSGGAGDDLIFGGVGNDTLNGNDGNDRLAGGAGTDILNGGNGNDTLIGGKGNDTLTGGIGSDVFRWELADQGAVGTPATDTIADFSTALPASGGDILDLRDLLVGETHSGSAPGTLDDYLHFEKVGANTIVHISTSGGFSGGFNAALDDQQITLSGVDLVTGFANDNAIITDLLTKSKLITD